MNTQNKNEEQLKSEINNCIKKIENMINENKPKNEIYQEKKKLDELLKSYLEKYN